MKNSTIQSQSRELSIQLVTQWLDYKKVSKGKRDKFKDDFDNLVFACEERKIIFNNDMSITHTLVFPIDIKGNTITEMHYSPQISFDALAQRMIGIPPQNLDLRIAAHVSAISMQPLSVVRKMDTQDFHIARSVTTFLF